MLRRTFYAFSNPQPRDCWLFYGERPDPSQGGAVLADNSVALAYMRSWLTFCDKQDYFFAYNDDLPQPQKGLMVGVGAQYAGPSYGNITGSTHDAIKIRKPSTVNPNHKTRMKFGEIVLSEHHNANARLSYNVGTKIISKELISVNTIHVTDATSGFGKNYANFLGFDYTTDWSAPVDYKMVQVAPRVWLSARFTFDLHLYTIETGYHPFDYGFSKDPFVTLCSYNPDYPIENQIPIDGARVTATIAKANSGDLDILTTLAEAPMTIATTLQGFTKACSMMTDVKTLDFKTTSVSKTTLQKWKKKFYEYQLSLSRKGRKKLSRMRVKTPEELFDYKLKASMAFADEFLVSSASVLLWWRYDLRPNIYLLDDMIKHMEAMIDDSAVRRYREKVVVDIVPPAFPGFTFDGVAQATHRYVCLRHYFLTEYFARLKRSLSVDEVVTLWELLWGSFMVDWVLNVGDVLAAMPDHLDDKAYNQGFQVSVKTEIKGLYRLDANPDVSVAVNLESYSSTPINPDKYLRLYYRNNLDSMKILDAAAIAFGLIRGKLRTSAIFKYL